LRSCECGKVSEHKQEGQERRIDRRENEPGGFRKVCGHHHFLGRLPRGKERFLAELFGPETKKQQWKASPHFVLVVKNTVR
jgi:hypothetical protein